MGHVFRSAIAVAICVLAASCSGGGSGNSGTPPPEGGTPPPPDPAPTGAFATANSTSRFLTMATFGPRPDDVAALTGTSASAWVRREFEKPASLYLDGVQDYYERGTRQQGMLADGFDQGATTWVFWRHAVHADDQLRQRMVFALSQILVVSNASGGLLGIFPQTLGYYQNILTRNAFGNYRDLLEEVTYSPAMAEYLTYLGNQKADPQTGRVPDENYAREILQLFTVGLVALNPDGTPQTGGDGEPIEIYDNGDITELAKVFTGLSDPVLERDAGFVGRLDQIANAAARPLTMDEGFHAPEAKSFLDTTIPAGTSGEETIRLALDHIMGHPNVGPFVSRQLIQRFVTSNPRPAYVARVAAAFDAGRYTLPDGSIVGEGRKGDLKATLAAILFDDDASFENAYTDEQAGKIREPVLRLSHFMRAFDTDMTTPEYVFALFDTSPLDVLGQHPFRSPSVFNFYRPGYIAPGTLSGDLGLTVPELQIVNASSTPGYINLLSYGAFQTQLQEFGALRPIFARYQVPFDEARARATFVPDYTEELALADSAEALVNHLDTLLLYGSMTDSTRRELINTLSAFPATGLEQPETREDFVGYAALLVMSSPDYLVQR